MIVMHTWAYRSNENVYFSLRSNIGKKKLLISQLCLNIFVIKAQYLIQSPKKIFLCALSFSNGMTVLFALLALNVIQAVFLQLKIILCDSA